MSGAEAPALIMLASAAVTTAGGLYSSSQQQKLDMAINNAETERARLAGAETALTASRDFRSALSSQLAIASLRGGTGGSLASQFGAESISNFLADQRSLESQQKFLGIRSSIRSSEIKSQRVARDTQSVGSLLKAGADAYNINKLTSKAGK